MNEYKGYRGSFEWSEEDQVFWGRILDIDDLVTYESKDKMLLVTEYHKAVDDYIAFKQGVGKA